MGNKYKHSALKRVNVRGRKRDVVWFIEVRCKNVSIFLSLLVWVKHNAPRTRFCWVAWEWSRIKKSPDISGHHHLFHEFHHPLSSWESLFQKCQPLSTFSTFLYNCLHSNFEAKRQKSHLLSLSLFVCLCFFPHSLAHSLSVFLSLFMCLLFLTSRNTPWLSFIRLFFFIGPKDKGRQRKEKEWKTK